MTEEQITDAVAWSMGGDQAAAKKIAKTFVKMAINNIARKRGVDFNREYKATTLTSGKGEYNLGVELFGGYPNLWSIEELWFTDTKGKWVVLLGMDDYNDRARGGTTTGRPKYGTVHSEPPILELYPIPDSAYAIRAYVTRKIDSLDDLPDIYHDVVYPLALSYVAASKDPNVAIALAKDGLNAVQADSKSGYTGSKIMVQRHLGTGLITDGSDSANLTGE